MKLTKILVITILALHSSLKAEEEKALIPLPMSEQMQKSLGIDKLTENEQRRLAVWLNERDVSNWLIGRQMGEKTVTIPPQTAKAATAPQKYLHPGAITYLKEKKEEGKILELEDGSQWLIDPASVVVTSFWLTSQKIRPANRETDGFTHILVNIDMLEAVKATNLKKTEKDRTSASGQ